MTDPDRLPLTAVPRALKEITINGETVPYHRVYRGVVDGGLEAEQDNNRRYFIRRQALPTVAQFFGLSLVHLTAA